MKNYPKEFYAKEKKPIHIIGYTVALGMMGVGFAETVHSLPYIVKGESTTSSLCLFETSRSCLLMVTNKKALSTLIAILIARRSDE